MTQENIPLQTNSKLVFRKVTIAEVKLELSKLRRKKSTDMDNISSSMVNDCSRIITRPLSYIINMSLSKGTFPTDWKHSKITPVYKSESHNSIEKYRPISIIPDL